MRVFFIFIFLAATSLISFEGILLGEMDNSADSSEQQIMQFELSGFGEQGKKTWDVKGSSADVLSDSVRLNDIVAKVYGEEDNMQITADAGNYDKGKGKVHLQDNVVVTTDSGAKLVTDSLDWYQDNQRVSSQDSVDITKDNLKVVGKGIEAEPNLKKVKLNEEVKVDIKDTDFSLAPEEAAQPGNGEKQPIEITCDGSLDVDYEKQIAVFNKNVKVVHAQGEIYADKMMVFFDAKGKTIERVECYNNVKIVSGENTTYSQEAVYTASDKKITLTGRPRLVIYSSEGLSASFGN